MDLALSFRFEQDDHALQIGFRAGGGTVALPADVALFTAAVESRCALLKAKVHLFFDLSSLEVQPAQVGSFVEAKRVLCDRYGLSVWHYGGQLAERVMTRNDCARHGDRPNLFKTRDEAFAAFRKSR